MSKDIKFVGLHGHSCVGSPFDALGFPEDHMDFAYENGSDALALTDHGNMNGLAYQVLHAKKMEKNGKSFKPIYGVEAYYHPSIDEWKGLKEGKEVKNEQASFVLEDEEESKKAAQDLLRHRRHIVLLAQNQKGLNNLFKLISTSFDGDNYYYKPRIDFELLKNHNEGIIASSACLGGMYAKDMWANHGDDNAIYRAMIKTTQQMLDVFGDRWYGELQWHDIPEQHVLNQFIMRLHKDFGIPLISTADSHYPTPETWQQRFLYKKLGWMNKKDMDPYLPQNVGELGYELYPKNGQQMWESYKKFGRDLVYNDDVVMQSLENTYEIAHQRIETFYPDSEVKLPDFVVPDGMTASDALVAMAFEGLRKKGFATDNEYVERLNKELDVIGERQFSKYFLTMKRVSDLAQEDRLTGPGRGSAAGALTSFCLGITQVDPIKYGLQFERFMLKDATGYPDIDFDLSRPMEFKEKLIEQWGANVVVPISNYNTLQPKSLIKDISKFYGIPFQEVNAVTSVMEDEAIPKAKAKHGIKSGVYKPTFDELIEFSESLNSFLEIYPQIKEHLKVLRGQVRSQSRHAGGVVIGQDLDHHMPLVKSRGVTQTPWTEGQKVRHLEPMGFIKYDLLGLQTLEIIELAIRLVLNKKEGREVSFQEVKSFYDKHLNSEIHDLDDHNVYKNIFHAGRFAATFQFTESGAQQFCEDAKPNSIVDIAAVTSIYRPGPLEAGVDEKYLEARYNPSAIHYAHPKAKEVTKETLGFLVFQEQISSLAHALGKDINLNEANKLRKLLTKNTSSRIGKRVASDAEKEIYRKFIDGCVERGLGKQTAQSIWDNFVFFSKYGFNKSHAVCYSIISYQCAWLLHYHPDEWFASYLTFISDNDKEHAISIAKQFGYTIGELDINRSGLTWDVGSDKILYPPLTTIKGIGENTVKAVIKYKPFNTIEELMFHSEISGREIGKKQLDAFIRSGAVDSLIDGRFTGQKHFWTAVAVDKPKTVKKLNENIEKYRDEGGFSKSEKLLNIQNLTGNYPISLVVSDEMLERIKEFHVPCIGEWDKADPLHRTATGKAMCWFVPIEKLEKKTKKGKTYWIIKVVDITGAVTEIKCWGIKPKDKIMLHHPFMAALDHDTKWGFSTRNIDKLKLLG